MGGNGYDFFIAHAGADKAEAEEFFRLLHRRARVFLDTKCLNPGDIWPQKLRDAVRTSTVTLVLISDRTDQAFFECEEIHIAINLFRGDPAARRVVPVYLLGGSPEAAPYGLTQIEALSVTESMPIDQVAARLLDLHRSLTAEGLARLLPELGQLLADLPSALSIIYQVAGAASPPPGLDVTGLLEWLSELVPDGRLPRPVQVCELAGQRALDPALREKFSLLSERMAEKVPDGSRLLSEFRRSAGSSGDPAVRPCLLAAIYPDRNGGDLYRLSLILYRGGHYGEPLDGDDACVSLDEIRGQLQKLLPVLAQTVDRASSLFVEFVVPRELLNMDFDQWLIPELPGGPPGRDCQLGVRYPVVVRDLERMGLGDRSHWQARWQMLRAFSGPLPPDSVRWIGPDDDKPYASFRAALYRAEEQVCLALLSAPSADSTVVKLLRAALDGGVPAAIWLRHSSAGRSGRWKDKKYLAAAVRSAKEGLPFRVLDLRREAEEKQSPAAHRGRHLSLLWDDPGRTCEPPPFVAPLLSPDGADI